jgi:O-antigen/teichoic acid export membrane protein
MTGAVRIGLAIVTIPMLIHFMGVEGYGLWILASTVIGLVGLAEAGLATATTVFVSRDLGKDDHSLALSQTLTVTIAAMFVLATSTAILLWTGADAIVQGFPKLGHFQQLAVAQALKIGGIVVWFRLFQQVLSGIEQAYQRYQTLNLINVLQWLLIGVGSIVAARSGGGVVELMEWQLLVGAVTLLAHGWVVRSLLQRMQLRFIWQLEKSKTIAQYSLKVWLVSLGTALFSRGDRLIVGFFLGSETLGIYAAIADAASAINSFSALPVQPLVPTLSNCLAQEETGRSTLNQQVKQVSEMNGLTALASGAWLFVFAPFVMQILIGSASEMSVNALRIMTVIYALFSLNAVGFYILITLNINAVVSIQLVSGVVALGLITVGALKFGLLGAALGNIGFLGTWLMIFRGMKQLDLSQFFWINCLKFPLLWFAFCVLTSILMVKDLALQTSVIIVQTTILVGWFLLVQRQNQKFAFRNLKP